MQSKGRLRRVAIGGLKLAGSAVLLLVLFEVATLYLVPGYDDMRRTFKDPDHRLPPHGTPEFNDHGIRERQASAEITSQQFNILVLGDSFVFGWALPYDDTVTEQLERLMPVAGDGRPVNAVNFGWVSSSPLLSLRLLHDIGAAYEPSLVVYCVDMTDFYDDILYRNIFLGRRLFALKSTLPATVITVHRASRVFGDRVTAPLTGLPSGRFFITDRPLAASRPWLEDIERNLDALAWQSEKVLGVPFTVFVFPRHYQYSRRESPASWEASQYEAMGPYVHEPFRWAEEYDARRTYDVYSMLADFQDPGLYPTTLIDDPHWNRRGAGVAARGMLRRLHPHLRGAAERTPGP